MRGDAPGARDKQGAGTWKGTGEKKLEDGCISCADAGASMQKAARASILEGDRNTPTFSQMLSGWMTNSGRRWQPSVWGTVTALLPRMRTKDNSEWARSGGILNGRTPGAGATAVQARCSEGNG